VINGIKKNAHLSYISTAKIKIYQPHK